LNAQFDLLDNVIFIESAAQKRVYNRKKRPIGQPPGRWRVIIFDLFILDELGWHIYGFISQRGGK
jgi:hypothetical protein